MEYRLFEGPNKIILITNNCEYKSKHIWYNIKDKFIFLLIYLYYIQRQNL